MTLAATLALAIHALPINAQATKSSYPPISAREFKGGSVKVKVTGSLSIDEEVQLNAKASIGSGDMTWLQYGASGAAEPNALITFTDLGETGINVGRGTVTATA